MPRRRRPTTCCCASWSTRSAAPTWTTYLPAARGGARATAATTAGRRTGARTTSRPTPTSGSSSSAPACPGLLAAHRLQQAGVAVRRSSRRTPTSAARGSRTRYPGCRVDNPNHNYSYSFAQRHDWPLHFSTQDVLLDYFRRCADAFGLRRPHPLRHRGACRRRGPTTDAALDGRACATPDGARGDARGQRGDQRGRPAQPARPTRTSRAATSFAGPSFHSARWDHDVDLAGKRVAVIGTGASAVQFIPEIAPVAGELLVFQRTPPWFGPTPGLPRRGARRAALAVRATCRPTASGTASGSSGGWATARSPTCASTRDWEPNGERGQRGQRLRAHDARPSTSRPSSPTAPTCSPHVVPDLPAGRQADAARQRRVGAERSSATTSQLVTDDDPRDHPDRHRHRRRRASTTST